MSTTKAFRGFIPARKKSGGYNNEAVTDMITLTSTGQAQSPTNSIFTGDPVVLPGANFATISPYIAATLKPSGVFMGCQYVENGEQKFSRYWPGGVSATDIKFFVITDPDQTYYIQASLSLSAGELAIVKNYNVTVSSTLMVPPVRKLLLLYVLLVELSILMKKILMLTQLWKYGLTITVIVL
jgi:hypothetical protein